MSVPEISEPYKGRAVLQFRTAFVFAAPCSSLRPMDASEATDEAEALLTTEEVAGRLRVSPETLATWRCTRRQQIPFVKVYGSLVRYRPSDLNDYLNAAGSVSALASCHLRSGTRHFLRATRWRPVSFSPTGDGANVAYALHEGRGTRSPLRDEDGAVSILISGAEAVGSISGIEDRRPQTWWCRLAPTVVVERLD